MLNTFNFPHLLLLLPPLRVCFPFEFLMESISSQQNMLEGRRKALRKVEELSFFGMILAASELFPRWTAVLACCESSNRSCKCLGIVTTFTVPWPECARSFGVYPSRSLQNRPDSDIKSTFGRLRKSRDTLSHNSHVSLLARRRNEQLGVYQFQHWHYPSLNLPPPVSICVVCIRLVE